LKIIVILKCAKQKIPMKREYKYYFDKDAFREILQKKGLTISELVKMPGFTYTEDDIKSALKTGTISHGLVGTIAIVLDIRVCSIIQ
jgi:hypothetical protein